MAETLTLTLDSPSTDFWQIESLLMRRGLTSDAGAIILDTAESVIKVTLIGENGCSFHYSWFGPSADLMILALNKVAVDLASVNSRVLCRLLADGVLSGVSDGSAD